ncbi:hypothetical protein CDAR_183681 [Caerostris darwini]|uniref:Uncharacterized protein n=1 Tax=Caerostris darwini TaxID=1538125 RepID=A0AAV4PZ67_9ARAC|nr:hypothetical protein CDAR_183681 [Caerostris darwini]
MRLCVLNPFSEIHCTSKESLLKVLTTNNRFSLHRKQKLAFNSQEDQPFFQAVRSLRMFSFPNQFILLILSSISPLAPNPFEDNQVCSRDTFLFQQIPIWHASKFEGVWIWDFISFE